MNIHSPKGQPQKPNMLRLKIFSKITKKRRSAMTKMWSSQRDLPSVKGAPHTMNMVWGTLNVTSSARCEIEYNTKFGFGPLSGMARSISTASVFVSS